MRVEVTRRMRFCAARRLARADWSEERNRSFFGRQMQWHGHDFVLDVTVRGEVSAETGMVLHLKELKSLIARHAVEALDHRDLGSAELLGGRVPTDENMVQALWPEIATRLATGLELAELTLHRGSDRAVSCRGES